MTKRQKDRAINTVPGIRTIAEKLGLSISTVHRALHNQGRVSPATRARVLRVAEQLEYKPNLAARNLRLNQRFRISVHFPEAITTFFDALRAGIVEGAEPYRSFLDLEFNSYRNSSEHAQKSIQAAIDMEVDGIITVPSNTPQMADLARSAKARGISLIYVSTDVPESERLTAITAYPFCCGAMAAEVLASGIKTRGKIIVLAGNLENQNQTEKIRGFRSMLAQIAPSLSVGAVLETLDSPERADREIRKSVQSMPRACAVYVSSANSISALVALKEMGRLEDMTIVTTDFFPELASYLKDGSVKGTIYQCPELQGSIAINTMYRYLMDGICPPSSIGVIPQLIIRSNLDLYVRM